MGHQDGVTALITGGSDGIGKAAATRLCAEGARVAICGRNEERLRAAAAEVDPDDTGRVLTIAADCREKDDLARVFRATTEAFGPVTALVNNVGTSSRGPFLEVTDEQWMEDLNLKLFSAIRMSRMVIRSMVELDSGGRIVNILSIGGKNPGPASGPTAVTRAAGLALTQALSKEFGPHGILVNAVCIGLVKAGQHDRRWRAAGCPATREEYYAQLAQQRDVPLGRVGEASEAADLINFLVSDQATFITGTAINLDGGASWSV